MTMRSIFKKLNIGSGSGSYSGSGSPHQSDDSDGPSPPSSYRGGGGGARSRSPSSRRNSYHHSEQKPPSGLSGWLSSVTGRNSSSSPPVSSTSTSPSGSTSDKREQTAGATGSVSSSDTTVVAEMVRRDSESSRPREDHAEMDEEYQIQLALELSAREDPEAVQIEAVKQISLGSCPSQNTPAEVLAYRYWNYNSIGYEDKILDGFYDLYGILAESTLVKMPSLVDLQETPVRENISWEAVLVNRASDPDLVKLEQKALVIALESKTGFLGFAGNDLVKSVANLVANHMGGAVSDPESILKSWTRFHNYLRESIGNMVLPLGRLSIGLRRHRALLFKVLADAVGIPCRLVKGQQYTGSGDGALNIVKFEDGREYIVDLMADPGVLIPCDAISPSEFDDYYFGTNALTEDAANSNGPSVSCISSSVDGFENEKRSICGSFSNPDTVGFSDFNNHDSQSFISSRPESSTENGNSCCDGTSETYKPSTRLSQPHSPSQSTCGKEDASSPAAREKKVKDVSEYMINAAKENPQLAQKLYDVLLESGIVAPPDLFSETYAEKSEDMVSEDMIPSQVLGRQKDELPTSQLEIVKPLEDQGLNRHLDSNDSIDSCSSQSEITGTQLPESSLQFIRNMPVAAAAATAAVVASTMVVAAAKTNSDINMEVPVAAAAAVVATTAAVTRQYEQVESGAQSPNLSGSPNKLNVIKKEGEYSGLEPKNSGEALRETERTSDKSSGNESVKSDISLDEVAEVEIPWEDIVLGERIGLGSFGEVYRGDWHGTEVAVKRFLHQDLFGDALEEFITEVRIMKRLRHPNVVLFMGAVTRVPNLSIVTEFLPRGSLFRLIHRPNNQLDERRRLRMAFDVARGMNYLHSSNPAIVHRDLKSPNLLVDRNWVVKVCDFGLSRIKLGTFISSRSTAGTAEWMAPEVLRNEPSNEKCDVFSFGVILWELCTLQQPWEGMNAMQVVGAVGFQHRRLDIPKDVDPNIAEIITRCWQTDPRLRPSFSEIMAALKPLLKPVTSSQAPRKMAPASDNQ